MNNLHDPQAELYEIIWHALAEANMRTLTFPEINALRYAAGVPEPRGDSGNQKEMKWD